MIKFCKETKKLRKYLDDHGIKWFDKSDDFRDLVGFNFYIERTHFILHDNFWSVIHGYGTYGGFNRLEKDRGLLELMTSEVNGGVPIGYFKAEDVIGFIEGRTNDSV
jgi:hypothetical protein